MAEIKLERKIVDENTSNFEDLNRRFSIVVLSQKNFPKIVRWSMNNIFFEIFSGTLKFLISVAAEIKSVSTRGLADSSFRIRLVCTVTPRTETAVTTN